MTPPLDSALKSEQLSVFLENRAGRLAEVIHLLARSGINIRAVSLADTSDFGILRMMVDDIAAAEQILRQSGFTSGRTSVVAIELEDRPGALDSLLQLMSQNGINVEYMYAYARRSLAKTVMIFRFDKIDAAIEILRQNGVAPLPAAELASF